ncbi:WD40-repeat-containing domain protein [Lobosporangium transversale]|uniref:WD40-repeat-containing domain protein n=1 Tax=Lobosporangium transversale TaxID=64571 RepID=A0A1Y2GRZ3_9FUNG|nr:WD40-repeat-containing domain protein [Lobosporangium transversale]ORZ20910.1 WD40-repeat-containing domain protein [Lobosporangium transversale]|eukprot:XP_021882819.1 WD40-repeat-containing domain protein [Lobosporangium transversale]
MKPDTDPRPNQNGTHTSSSSAEDVNGNGATTSSLMSVDSLQASSTTPFGFNRHELVRLMVQSLQSLGYRKSAQELEAESGFQLESPAVTLFRECVLKGAWDELEQLSEQLELDPAHHVSVKFLIREQKFLELLEARQIKNALIVLRSELTPLNHNMERVHTLTSYMMSSSAEDLRQRADWDGANGTSRQTLLSSLQKYISPAVMVPENRLETMLKQAIELQVKNCLYHNHRNTTNSLYSDHACEKTGIPSVSRGVLRGHTNEVWYISFSHDGKYLASASQDTKVIIWSMETFEAIHTLEGHQKEVSWCVWSPDDTQLLTTGFDKMVKLWDVQTATCKSTFNRHNDTVNCLGWLPDGERFLSGSGRNLFLMTTTGEVLRLWQFAVRDMAISADGKTLVVMGGTVIRIINLEDMSTISTLEETDGITAISLSKDGQFLLANITPKHAKHPLHREVHLWNLTEGRIVRKYSGYMQGLYVIRSCFGGWDERFVISGSEDLKIYIWHRENGNLIQTLDGHTGPVTVVSWNLANPTMFASASDDHTIRIWGTSEDTESDHARILNGSSL